MALERERYDVGIAGHFEKARDDGRPETIYFAVPIGEEWSAFELRQSGPLMAVSREWVFRPEAAQQGLDLTR
jgi:hypothetical protein